MEEQASRPSKPPPPPKKKSRIKLRKNQNPERAIFLGLIVGVGV